MACPSSLLRFTTHPPPDPSTTCYRQRSTSLFVSVCCCHNKPYLRHMGVLWLGVAGRSHSSVCWFFFNQFFFFWAIVEILMRQGPISDDSSCAVYSLCTRFFSEPSTMRAMQTCNNKTILFCYPSNHIVMVSQIYLLENNQYIS